MKKAAFRLLAVVYFLLAANFSLLVAQNVSSPDAVTIRTNRTLLQSGGELTLLKEPMTMPGGIKVSTNGTYQVNNGKVRNLNEGQFLRSDGFLLNPDHSMVPVFDHIAMNGGQVMVYKDGDATALEKSMTLPDGSIINPDGSYERGTRRSRLVDGQLLTLDGNSMGGLDSITLRDGKVVVYKCGAVLPLATRKVIMGMYDGTKVRGDGFVMFTDGNTLQLTEGQMLTVPGVRADW